MVLRVVVFAGLAAIAALHAGCDGGQDEDDGDSMLPTVDPPDGAGSGASGTDGDDASHAGQGASGAHAGGGRDGGAGTDAADAGALLDASDEPFVPVPIAELPVRFAEAICDALQECVGESALRQLTDREDCAVRIEAELRATEFHHMDEAIASGRVLYDAAQLPACLAGVRELGCGVLSESYPQPCVDVLAGNVALERDCTISAECQGTAFCAGAATDECPSVCTELLARGGACAADNECGNGLLCIAGACEPPAAVGEPCGGDSGRTCALGLNCMGSSDVVAGECVDNGAVQVGTEDAPCEPGGTLCREGLSCVFDGAGAFHCQPPVAADQACRLGLPGQCPLDQYCDAASVTDEGTCRALPGDGDDCVLGDVCRAGLVCVVESESALCRPIRDNGGECSADRACRSQRCVDGTCAPPATCAL